ncbi:hypothetical protein HC256_003321 [Beauveria bassiana]|nr:hypothetical protein HC256_003321 [Beauveria bassiana]
MIDRFLNPSLSIYSSTIKKACPCSSSKHRPLPDHRECQWLHRPCLCRCFRSCLAAGSPAAGCKGLADTVPVGIVLVAGHNARTAAGRMVVDRTVPVAAGGIPSADRADSKAAAAAAVEEAHKGHFVGMAIAPDLLLGMWPWEGSGHLHKEAAARRFCLTSCAARVGCNAKVEGRIRKSLSITSAGREYT